jgi:hypothetical protein
MVAVMILARAMWPTLGPVVSQRSALSAAARTTDAGIPVPRSAERCRVQGAADSAAVRWCLPAGVSATTVEQWYDRTLPPGRDAGGLRWCVEQYGTNGSRLALWSTDGGLVGYQLPPLPPHLATGDVEGAMAVAVVVLPGAACPAAARTSRGQA